MEINFVFVGDAADFFERLDGAEFVVGVHHGDENGFGADGVADGIRDRLGLRGRQEDT